MKKPAIDHYNQYNPTWKERLNPIWWFGNVKWTPECPDFYYEAEHKGKSMKWATFVWYIRNPFQNFTHYVIGISDKADTDEYTIIGRDVDNFFSPTYNLNYWVVKYKWIVLPGMSFWYPIKKREDGNINEQLNFHFQIGWKMGGNFGMALRRQIGL